MLSTVQADLHRAVENVIKELNHSYNRYKKAEEEAEEARGKAFDLNASNECLTSINDNLKGTVHNLIQRIKELKGQCAALQAEKEKFGHEIVALQEALRAAELAKARPEIFSTFNVHLSDEAEKIAELNKEVADLQKENRELCEQLKSKSILDTVCFGKYWKQQIALKSDVGKTFECELNDGLPFEKGYYLRISKEEYELSRDDSLSTRVVFVKMEE